VSLLRANISEIKTILRTKPSFVFDPRATYLIAGGLGGIGLSISRWMASRGVKNLLLLSRSGTLKDGALDFKAEIKEKGVRVELPACDVADKSSLRAVLKQHTRTMPPIKGCIQASVVVKV
jgi:short-subunit dehydrogenase